MHCLAREETAKLTCTSIIDSGILLSKIALNKLYVQIELLSTCDD